MTDLLGKTLLALCLTLLSTSCFAEIHKWTDENGIVHFSAQPPSKGDSKQINVDVVQASSSGFSVSQPLVNSASTKKNKQKAKKIVMYATSWCPYCQKARDYFIKNGLKFTEYDVEQDESKMRKFKRLGGSGYPLIMIGKDQQMQGFSVSGFERRYYDKKAKHKS